MEIEEISYWRAYQGQTLNLLSVIIKRVSMYYCQYLLTSWHMVISQWKVIDSVQLSNCQRYDQEHNRAGKKERSAILLQQMNGYWTSKTYEMLEKKSLKNPTMKAYPVKHLTVCHSLRRSSSRRCCHLPLILWLFFSLYHPLSPLPDSVSSSADSSKIQLLLRRVQQEKWGTLSTLPRLRFSPEECISFSHKQFQQLTTEAVLLYYSSPDGYWDDDLYGSLISNLSCPVTHFLELFTLNGHSSYLMFLDDCSYLVGFYPYQIHIGTDIKEQ